MKNTVLAAALLAALSLPMTVALAAEPKPAPAKPAASKPAAAARPAASKPAAAKHAAAKPAASKPVAAKHAVAHKEVHKAAPKAPAKKPVVAKKKFVGKKAPEKKAAEAAPPPAETLTPVEQQIAQRIYVGNIPCELGAHLQVAADPGHPGFFNVSSGKRKYTMHPVESRTGAVRMEDDKHQAVLLQLSTKSMLMDQKIGQRVVDECKSPDQTAFAAQMKDHPPPNLLSGDAPKK